MKCVSDWYYIYLKKMYNHSPTFCGFGSFETVNNLGCVCSSSWHFPLSIHHLIIFRTIITSDYTTIIYNTIK